jgi:glutaredoxin
MREPRYAMRWSLILALLISGATQAQELYRWTDEKGRVHVTDTPPPASARNVQKKNAGATAVESGAAQPNAGSGPLPYELVQAMKEYPVTLYTASNCKEGCAMARAALNKRGVPFKEVAVSDEKTNAELKERSGGNSVPTLLVGDSVQTGFQQEAFDALLDAARYPRTGLLPARAQGAPVSPEEREAAKTATAKSAAVEEEAPKGPYSPGSKPPPRRTPQKP